MDRLRRIVGNTFVSLLGQMVTWTSTLVLTIAYGRFLSDTAFGELYLAITFVALVGFPLEFGFNQQLTRDVAQKPEEAQRYLSNVLLLKGCFWVILFALIMGLSFLLGYKGEEIPLIMIAGVSLLADAIANVFSSLHYALERVTFPVIGGILQKGLSALIGTILLKNGAGVEVMALVLLGGSFTNTIWQAIWGFRAAGLPFAINRKLMVHLLRTCVPFIVYGVLAVIYYRIDTVLLSFMADAEVIGWYGAAYRLLDTLNFLPNLVIFSIMYPIFAKFSLSDKTGLKLAVEKSMNFLLLCGMPIATLMIVAAPSIIGFLYHQEQYIHSVPALQALAPGLLFLYANTVLGSLLMSIKLEKKITIMAAFALVFNLGLNLLLIPLYQHVGAAAVTSLTELLLLCFSIAFTPREFLPWKSLVTGAKALLACVVMSLVIWKFLLLNIFIILPIAITTYVVIILVLRAVPREDLSLLLNAVRQKATGATGATASLHQEEQEKMLEPTTYLADEDTVPMKAVYRLQQIQPNLDLNLLDTLQLKAIVRQERMQNGGQAMDEEDTLQLKAIVRLLQAHRNGPRTLSGKLILRNEQKERTSRKTTPLVLSENQLSENSTREALSTENGDTGTSSKKARCAELPYSDDREVATRSIVNSAKRELIIRDVLDTLEQEAAARQVLEG